MQARELEEDGEDILCNPVLRGSSVLAHPLYKQFTNM